MSTVEKVKKPFYKKWWVWLIVIIFIGVIATSGGEDEANDGSKQIETSAPAENDIADKDEEKVDSEQNIEDEPEEDVAEDVVEDTAKSIGAGTYKVGSEIPAGEYLVFSNGMAYIESAKDSTGSLDSILFNDNLMGNAHSYVTLNDGEYFKLTGGEMYPVAEAPSVIPSDGKYKDGMYKVGTDIPAGEHKVILDSSIGMGYLEVSSNSSHNLGSIVTNEILEADTYITVSEGQYLKLQDAYIQK